MGRQFELNGKAKFSIQEELGYRAQLCIPFRVKIPNCPSIFKPIYLWKHRGLYVGNLVGHVIVVHGEPNLLITRITKINAIEVISIPILHSGDTRSIQDLAVPEFHIPVNQIHCKFIQCGHS
jgi:hypothetical protein